MQENINVGMIGAGAIATEGHIPNLKRIPYVSVIAVCDANIERARSIAEEFNIPKIYDKIDDLLSNPDIDAVLIALPNYLHASTAISALKYGKHVFCEKPLATTVNDGEEMVRVAKENNKVLAVNMEFRYAAEMVVIKKMLSEKLLGDIRYMHIRFLRRNGIPGFGSWFTSREKAGGGVLVDLGVHMIDIAMWLMDFPNVTSIFCKNLSDHGPCGLGQGNWGSDQIKGGFYDVEDFSTLQIQLESGCLISLDLSWAVYGKDEERVQIIGEKGGVDINPEIYGFDNPLRIYLYEGNKPIVHKQELPFTLVKNGKNICAKFAEAIHNSTEPTDEGGQTDLWYSSINCFIESVRCNACTPATGEDALRVQKIIEAAYRSAQLGQAVKF